MSESHTTPSGELSPLYYVAIGASAGGLEALQEFFSHLAVDTGATYIVVQHLSPDYKSMMPELLRKHTDMPIHQVSEGMMPERNAIYLMPARKNMEIHSGKLKLINRAAETHVHAPIDAFLQSLALDQQHLAVGIVLSGTGSDGSRGIKALKEHGGMVVIQDPKTAKFDGMPMSAFNTGFVDLVLPASEMGEKLVSYMQHPAIASEDSSLFASFNDANSPLSDIFDVLKKHSSISFSNYKASTVGRRIERRMGINQLTSLEAYFRFLLESQREVHILSKELLIGVTRFFRDKEAFFRLSQEVVPRIVKKYTSKSDSIRIWVAGCSTGEEAYSMAMLFLDEVERNGSQASVKVFATDVDDNAIATASAGIYSGDIEQDITEERLKKYFTKRGDVYTVTQELRQSVIFATHNMMDDPPFSNIDLVSCRNVLIYFQSAAQKKVLSSLYFALKDQGILFLGGSESLGDLLAYFHVVDDRSRLFRKAGSLRLPLFSPSNKDPSLQSPAQGGLERPVSPSAHAIPRRLEECVLERLVNEYAPDCIVINDSFNAVHIYGDVSLYTRGVSAGRVSNNIKDMVVDDLSIAVSTALYRSEKNEADVFYKDVVLGVSDTEQIVIDLTVFYIKESDHSSAPRYFIVQFIQHRSESGEPSTPSRIPFDASAQSQQRIHDLEQELIKKQEHLQVTVEELETTNEELQSANEELMSANEELQSTNEELQSVNEELYTVNSEYQQKIVELTESNDDLDHVFNTTDVGIVFLDAQLAIRKYTLWCTRYINMRMSDIGRPFSHISHSFQYDDFSTDIISVSNGGSSIEKEIISQQGHILYIRILPYQKHSSSMQTGVLVTIANVSRYRFMEQALQRTQDELRGIFLEQGKKPAPKAIKVLLLDDNLKDGAIVQKLLEDTPGREFNVRYCSTIKQALVLAKEETFDVYLVDYVLGELTAKDFIGVLQKEKVFGPTIVLSSYSANGLDMSFLEEDILDFLSKDELMSPLLVRSIDYVLERYRLKQALVGLDKPS